MRKPRLASEKEAGGHGAGDYPAFAIAPGRRAGQMGGLGDENGVPRGRHKRGKGSENPPPGRPPDEPGTLLVPAGDSRHGAQTVRQRIRK